MGVTIESKIILLTLEAGDSYVSALKSQNWQHQISVSTTKIHGRNATV